MAVKFFFSYSQQDGSLRDKLAAQLSILERQDAIATWHEREILAGEEREKEIDAHLKAADIILLLVSADFLASDSCWDVEVQEAMARYESGKARVIPIILRPCQFKLPKSNRNCRSSFARRTNYTRRYRPKSPTRTKTPRTLTRYC